MFNETRIVYSMRSSRQLSIEGEIGGIFNNCPSQVAVLCGWIDTPVTVVNLMFRERTLRPARNCWVWCKVAWGMMVLWVWFSNSALMAIDSPVISAKHYLQSLKDYSLFWFIFAYQDNIQYVLFWRTMKYIQMCTTDSKRSSQRFFLTKSEYYKISTLYMLKVNY